MKKWTTVPLIVVVSLLAVGYGLLHAQKRTTAGSFWSYGLGSEFTCGEWVTERAKGKGEMTLRVSLLGTWVYGYLTGYGASHGGTKASGGTMRVTDADAVNVWLDDYCRTHALESLTEAAGRLAVELTKP